jgi:putative transposase
MQSAQKPANKSKFCLKMHLIFVVKYRKRLLASINIDTVIKAKILSLQTKDFRVDVMESDKDHVHLLVSYSPNVSVAQIVRKLKQETTIDIWRKFDLSRYFWKEHTFWSNGYFACSIGESSEKAIRNYIESQG